MGIVFFTLSVEDCNKSSIDAEILGLLKLTVVLKIETL